MNYKWTIVYKVIQNTNYIGPLFTVGKQMWIKKQMEQMHFQPLLQIIQSSFIL